ncbi:MAG: enoyl-CoA hydratase-related protein [Bacteroidota bacterium]
MYTHLLTEVQDQTLIITLNRPDALNALNQALLSELSETMDAFLADKNLKGAIITGSGERAFAAGADISELAHASAEEASALSRKVQKLFSRIEASPKPVIAAINGFALGGGLELAMGCHMRLASDNARFGQPEVNLGLLTGYGGSQRLVQIMGRGPATELLITGRIIKAEEAVIRGLVNRVVPQKELIGACQEILQQAYQKSSLAIAYTLDAIAAGFRDESGYEYESELFGKAISSHDGREGTAAFLEKRSPNFKGE